MTICTLTIKDDLRGEYEDDLQHRRADGKHIPAPLGQRRLTRAVVGLLHEWVTNNSQCSRRELMVLGTALFEIAFGDADPLNPDAAPMLKAFEETLNVCRKVEQPLRLRLVLESTAQELGKYPWEFLYMDRGEGKFLAGQDTGLTLTRYVPNSDTWEKAPEDDLDRRLRVLVVLSMPRIPNMTELKVGGFVHQLLQLDTTRFNTKSLESPTKMELEKEIKHMLPHVIHFIGHGRPGMLALRKDGDQLAEERRRFEDETDHGRRPPAFSEANWIDAFSARQVLRAGLERKDAPQRLIFLHACEGATATDSADVLQGFSDVARSLMGGERISGVIAMQYTIAVDEAELFAKAFYSEISKGLRIDEAVRAARQQFAETPVRENQQNWDSRGFGTPVIYLRSEDALVAPPEKRGAGKELCPNASCPTGYVIRTAQPQKCRSCQYPFVECPECPTGLVVPKPGFGCSQCPYVFQATASEGPADAPDTARGVTSDQSLQTTANRVPDETLTGRTELRSAGQQQFDKVAGTSDRVSQAGRTEQSELVQETDLWQSRKMPAGEDDDDGR